MRELMLVAGASLAISACNNSETAENTANVDSDLAAQNITANDTTSIDAATAEDANMAAETQITVNELDNGADLNGANESTGNNAS